MIDVLDVKLPRVIFISGKDRDARTRLANGLAEIRSEGLALSFEEPLRGAIRGAFFQCDPALDLDRNDNQTIPHLSLNDGAPPTFLAFRLAFHSFLCQRYGSDVLGRIGACRIMEEKDFFDTFIFDDAGSDLLVDVKAVVELVGKAECLIVHIGSAPPPIIKDIRTIITLEANPDPKDILAAYHSLLKE